MMMRKGMGILFDVQPTGEREPGDWWRQIPMGDALEILEKSQAYRFGGGDSAKHALDLLTDSNPVYLAAQQLLMCILRSQDSQERQQASGKIDELLTGRDKGLALVIMVICFFLSGMGFNIRPIMAGKSQVLLELLHEHEESEGLRQKYGKEVRPPIVAALLGKTQEPQVIPLLEEWLEADVEKLAQGYPFSLMKGEDLPLFRFHAASALFEIRLGEAYKVLARQQDFMDAYHQQQQFIEFLKKPVER